MRAEKQLLLDEIQGKVEGSDTFIVTRYDRLSANQANEFRGITLARFARIRIHFDDLLHPFFGHLSVRMGPFPQTMFRCTV